MTLSQQLRAAIDAHQQRTGLSLAIIAYRAGLSTVSLQAFHEGRGRLGMISIDRLAQALAVRLKPKPDEQAPSLSPSPVQQAKAGDTAPT